MLKDHPEVHPESQIRIFGTIYELHHCNSDLSNLHMQFQTLSITCKSSRFGASLCLSLFGTCLFQQPKSYRRCHLDGGTGDSPWRTPSYENFKSFIHQNLFCVDFFLFSLCIRRAEICDWFSVTHCPGCDI